MVSGSLIPVVAVFLGLAFGAVIILASGGDVWLAYRGLYEGSLGSPNAISETLVAATPYIFAGLGIALAFKAGLFNVGAEGQIAAGALASAWVGYSVHGLPWPLHLLLALAAGCLAGAVWGGIPGALKARTGAHEVITTIMLNYVAIQATGFLLSGAMRDPTPALAIAQTPPVLESARLPALMEPYRASWSLVLALLATAGAWWLLFRSTLGFELRTVGANPNAARYAGIPVGRTVVLAMALAGLLGGLAGAAEVVGVNYYHSPSFNTGYGFDAIAVALLGKAHPAGVVPAALLFGALRAGAPRMQFLSQIPADIIQIIQAVVLLFVAAEYAVRWVSQRAMALRPSTGLGNVQ